MHVHVVESVLKLNDDVARFNRDALRAAGVYTIDLIGGPGCGKTTLVEKTIAALRDVFRIGVIVGDLTTARDAERIAAACGGKGEANVIQINTGKGCHLEAHQVRQAMEKIDIANLDLLIIENVGNLVCPASYDLGEDLRVVLLSVTEGEDKPLKYPPMFQSANVVVVSKTDLAEACSYDREAALANIRRVAPNARVFETSAKTGRGMDTWREFLVQKQQERKTQNPLSL